MILAACSGGGSGGNAATPPGGNAGGTPSVQGDMLGLSPGRGWNYQTVGTASTGPITVSIYDDVTAPDAGTSKLVAVAVPGLVPTALTSQASAQSNTLATLNVVQTSQGDTVTSYSSKGGSGLIPGGPLFVANSLTLHQTFTPYPGVSEVVTAVGPMPNASACPVPASGATVQYLNNAQTYTISFVPGCGMTQIISPNGISLNLISVANYASTIGNL